jgi:hypothetical protein
VKDICDIGLFICGMIITNNIGYFPLYNDDCPDILKNDINGCVAFEIFAWVFSLKISFYIIGIGLFISLCIINYFCGSCISWSINKIKHMRNHISDRRMLDLMSRTMTISEEAPDDVCAICIEDKNEGDTWRELPCGHKFHPLCVDNWIVSSQTCPTCRTDMTAPLIV